MHPVSVLCHVLPAGLTWQPVVHPSLTGMDSRGSFLDTNTTPATVYHATPAGIYAWPDGQPDKLTTVSPCCWGCSFAGILVLLRLSAAQQLRGSEVDSVSSLGADSLQLSTAGLLCPSRTAKEAGLPYVLWL